MTAWVEEALSTTRRFVAGALRDDELVVAGRVLDALEARRAELETAGRERFLALLGRSVVGSLADASSRGGGVPTREELVWLEVRANAAERRHASRVSSQLAHAEAERRRAAAEAVRQTLIDLGSEAVRVALPFLLAALEKE